MYSGFEFGARNTTTNQYEVNAWRILDPGTLNSNGDYVGTKIISTGIPAKLYFHRKTNADTAASTWWGTASQVEALYGSTYSAAGYVYDKDAEKSGYPNCYAAAGMVKKFTSIPFANTPSPSANNAGYTSITNNASVSGTTYTTNGSIFITTKASTASGNEIHALTLEELNTAINKKYPTADRDLDSTDSVSAYDLFHLNLLEEYNDTTYAYWVAYPQLDTKDGIYCIGNTGSFMNKGSNNAYGIRPVITLNSRNI